METELYLFIFYLSLFQLTGAVTFNNPGTVPVNENTDAVSDLWTIDATCFPQDSYGNVTMVDCSYCTISSNPQSGLFEISGKTVGKKACLVPTCGSCPSCPSCSASNGCTTSGQSYNIGVTCQTNGWDTDDSGTTSFTVSITGETPALTLTLASPLDADNTMAKDTILTTPTTTPGLTIRDWEETQSVESSYSLGTSQLFAMKTDTGQIIVNEDPSYEYSYTYNMTICAYSRRQTACKSTTINFSGCFQTPTCNDQTDTFVNDTHAIGATLFTVDVNDPSDHFSSISATWQGLSFVEVSSTLSVTTVDPSTGIISTTGNITVHPNYPSVEHTVVVRVSNSESCFYNTTCTMTFTVYFTNWPIEIINNVTTKSIHEDTDARTTLFNIIAYDYNDPDEDNVTCTMTNPEPTLFELVQDGAHDYDSYYIVKKNCTDPGCGFLCDLNIGCMNWNLTKSYTFVVTCSDAYGSSDDETFTLNVNRNEIFQWRNLPMTITINSDSVAQWDVLFSILYTDAEGEDLSYNYSVSPAQPSPALFGFDSSGNYYNNLANVTSLLYEWDVTNTTYTVTVCAKERRNYKCEDLTIQIREYCGPTPTCDTASTTVTDQDPAGTNLLTINAPAPATGSYTSLSYAIKTEHTDLFTVDPVTGIITSTATLPVTNPPASTKYSIVGLVYDSGACDYASCPLTVMVNFTNFPISIDNMASVSVSIHEDTKTSLTLHTIVTSDNNDNDEVSCVVNEANSVPANNGKFYTVETYENSNIFMIVSKSNPGFDYDVETNYTVVVDCSDKYGSSDSANMTVTIAENQPPTMDNLDSNTVVSVDPLNTFSGATIFTLQTSDAENDELTYSCNVSSTWVPLECVSDGVVSLRRNIYMPDENGTIYNITMCIYEPVHNHTLCEDLQVNFTTSKMYPVLNNLPADVYFAENTAVGTSLFDVSVQDPDAGDVHTFSIVSVSPSDATSKFSIDSTTGEITLESALDYETQTNYNVTVSVSDQYLTTLEDRVLTVNVNNSNESPLLVLYGNSFNTTEGSANRQIGKLVFSCTDPDMSESLTFDFTAGTYMNYFSLNGISGILTHALEWDFESGASLPESTNLVVACTDDEGLSSTATVFISIAKVNEYAPALNTYAENITIYSNHTLFDPLLNVTATDADYPPDGNFTFSIAGVGQGATYFTINSQGQLFVSQYIDWKYNFTFEFTILVSDDDTDPLTSSVDVTVIYIAPNDTTIPTKPTKCILCTMEGIIVVSALCTEALLLLICLSHICIRMKAYSIFLEKPPPTTGVPRRKPKISDLRQDLENWSDEEEPEIAEIAENKETPPTDMFRPGSECMNRALPERRPPSVFNYYEEAPTPPPPSVYNEPEIDLRQVPEPVATPSEVIPITGYEDDIVNPTVFPGRWRRGIRTIAELAPSVTAAKSTPKRTIPQLYRDDDYPAQPIKPHEAPAPVSNPLLSISNRRQPLLSLPSQPSLPLSPVISSEIEDFDLTRVQNSSPYPNHTWNLSPEWELPGSASPNLEPERPWREDRPLPATRPNHGMDF